MRKTKWGAFGKIEKSRLRKGLLVLQNHQNGQAGKYANSILQAFLELAGAEEIRLKSLNPISVRELWGMLETEVPPLQSFVKREGDEVQNFFAVIVRGDEILKLDDTVGNEDVVKILPPISGG